MMLLLEFYDFPINDSIYWRINNLTIFLVVLNYDIQQIYLLKRLLSVPACEVNCPFIFSAVFVYVPSFFMDIVKLFTYLSKSSSVKERNLIKQMLSLPRGEINGGV